MHTNTKVIKFYFHSSKETGWDYATEIWPDAEFKGSDSASQAATNFRWLGAEVETDVEVDLDTGECRYLTFEGSKLDPPGLWQ